MSSEVNEQPKQSSTFDSNINQSKESKWIAKLSNIQSEISDIKSIIKTDLHKINSLVNDIETINIEIEASEHISKFQGELMNSKKKTNVMVDIEHVREMNKKLKVFLFVFYYKYILFLIIFNRITLIRILQRYLKRGKKR